MKRTKEELTEALRIRQFPRSARYDPEWVIANLMGPNVLWLTESLTQVMDLEPGMRVLDMGCGKAASSIFLAKEFGVHVWAADLWIEASDNLERSGVVTVELADMTPDGWKHRITSDEIVAEWRGEHSDEAEYMRLDAGMTLGFTRMVACRRTETRWRH